MRLLELEAAVALVGTPRSYRWRRVLVLLVAPSGGAGHAEEIFAFSALDGREGEFEADLAAADVVGAFDGDEIVPEGLGGGHK